MRMFENEIDKVVAPPRDDLGGIGGNHVGRTRLPIQKRQFAENIAYTQQGEDKFATVLVHDIDLDPPLANDEKFVSFILGQDEKGAPFIAAGLGQLGQVGELCVGEAGEEFDLAQEFVGHRQPQRYWFFLMYCIFDNAASVAQCVDLL